jgi:hypothetical protein
MPWQRIFSSWYSPTNTLTTRSAQGLCYVHLSFNLILGYAEAMGWLVWRWKAPPTQLSSRLLFLWAHLPAIVEFVQEYTRNVGVAAKCKAEPGNHELDEHTTGIYSDDWTCSRARPFCRLAGGYTDLIFHPCLRWISTSKCFHNHEQRSDNAAYLFNRQTIKNQAIFSTWLVNRLVFTLSPSNLVCGQTVRYHVILIYNPKSGDNDSAGSGKKKMGNPVPIEH